MLRKAESTITISLYACSQVAGRVAIGHYTLRFHQLLDYSEVARFIVDAKTEVQIRQARLAQRLAELFAIQYTYAHMVASPVTIREESLSRSESVPPTSPSALNEGNEG